MKDLMILPRFLAWQALLFIWFLGFVGRMAFVRVIALTIYMVTIRAFIAAITFGYQYHKNKK